MLSMWINRSLKIDIDRLEVFKLTSSSIVLTVEKIRNKIELFIQTNDVPRLKAFWLLIEISFDFYLLKK